MARSTASLMAMKLLISLWRLETYLQFVFGGVRHEHIMTLIQLVQDIKYNLHPNFDEEAGYCMARNVELTH